MTRAEWMEEHGSDEWLFPDTEYKTIGHCAICGLPIEEGDIYYLDTESEDELMCCPDEDCLFEFVHDQRAIGDIAEALGIKMHGH